MSKAIKPHFAYIGGKIKEHYLSYAFCSCGKYLLPKTSECSKCKEKVDWTDAVERLRSINKT